MSRSSATIYAVELSARNMVQTPPAVQTHPEAPTSLDTLAAQINSAHDRFQQAYKTSLALAYQIGGLLVQAKAQVAHGDWLSWVEENCAFGERTAQAYMRIFRQWDSISKSAETADLSIDGALQLLSEKNDVVEAELVEEEAPPQTAKRSRKLRAKGRVYLEKRETAHAQTTSQPAFNEFSPENSVRPPGFRPKEADPRVGDSYSEKAEEIIEFLKIVEVVSDAIATANHDKQSPGIERLKKYQSLASYLVHKMSGEVVLPPDLAISLVYQIIDKVEIPPQVDLMDDWGEWLDRLGAVDLSSPKTSGNLEAP